jgi:hypothetical protein
MVPNYFSDDEVQQLLGERGVEVSASRFPTSALVGAIQHDYRPSRDWNLVERGAP